MPLIIILLLTSCSHKPAVSEWMAGISGNEIQYEKIRTEDRVNKSEMDK